MMELLEELGQFASVKHMRSRSYYNASICMLLRALTIGAMVLAGAYAQFTPSDEKNPLTRDAAAVQAGRALYLERCAVCHGQDAMGSMAANLVRSRTVTRGNDGALFQVILKGFPGTDMPPQPDLAPEQIWQLVSYLHSLSRPGLQPAVPGDVAAGRETFERVGCAGCHQVDGAGGFLGPALDSIAARKTSEAIRSDVVDPSAALLVGYEAVTATMRDGNRIEGILKNEDTFSVQILTRDGRFRLLDRTEVNEIKKPSTSPMPSGYVEKLSDEELQNILAYLDRQRDAYVPVLSNFSNY